MYVCSLFLLILSSSSFLHYSLECQLLLFYYSLHFLIFYTQVDYYKLIKIKETMERQTPQQSAQADIIFK